MAIEIFGDRVEYNISAQCQRLRGDSSQRRGINCQNCPNLVCRFGGGFNVGHCPGGVGWGFNPNQISVRAHGICQCTAVVGIKQCQRNATLVAQSLQPIARAIIHGARGHHMAAHRHGFEQHGDGRHARNK